MAAKPNTLVAPPELIAAARTTCASVHRTLIHAHTWRAVEVRKVTRVTSAILDQVQIPQRRRAWHEFVPEEIVAPIDRAVFELHGVAQEYLTVAGRDSDRRDESQRLTAALAATLAMLDLFDSTVGWQERSPGDLLIEFRNETRPALRVMRGRLIRAWLLKTMKQWDDESEGLSSLLREAKELSPRDWEHHRALEQPRDARYRLTHHAIAVLSRIDLYLLGSEISTSNNLTGEKVAREQVRIDVVHAQDMILAVQRLLKEIDDHHRDLTAATV